jgi:hypothetical protein
VFVFVRLQLAHVELRVPERLHSPRHIKIQQVVDLRRREGELPRTTRRTTSSRISLRIITTTVVLGMVRDWQARRRLNNAIAADVENIVLARISIPSGGGIGAAAVGLPSRWGRSGVLAAIANREQTDPGGTGGQQGSDDHHGDGARARPQQPPQPDSRSAPQHRGRCRVQDGRRIIIGGVHAAHRHRRT